MLTDTPIFKEDIENILGDKNIPWSKLDGKGAKPVLDGVFAALALILCTASLISSSYNPFLYFRF